MTKADLEKEHRELNIKLAVDEIHEVLEKFLGDDTHYAYMLALSAAANRVFRDAGRLCGARNVALTVKEQFVKMIDELAEEYRCAHAAPGSCWGTVGI